MATICFGGGRIPMGDCENSRMSLTEEGVSPKAGCHGDHDRRGKK